jgi:signal transduction histidine kinase
MKFFDWKRFGTLHWLLTTERPEPTQRAERIVAMQRDVVLPSKAGVFLVVLYYLFYSGWFEAPSTRSVVLETMRHYFEVYLICTFVGALLFFNWRRLPPGLFQWLAFTLGLLDGLFMVGMTIITGGYDSIAFWVFPGLIVLNALSIPLAVPQIVLNLSLSVFYMAAVLSTPSLNPPTLNSTATVITGVPGRSLTSTQRTNQTLRLGGELPTKPNKIPRTESFDDINPEDEIVPEQLILRVSVLWLLTICCYGAQLLLERQRQAIIEAAEFASRQGQLQSAGRLAAEFAHQIKNPLAVISNAAYSLQRSLRENKNSAAQQIEIIQEEVARADKVITQIMGYAQLSEGRVEKLAVIEEIESSAEQVFPAAVPIGIKLEKHFAGPFPPLLMQRGHLTEILVNLLQNAREALNGRGTVVVSAKTDRTQAVEITVADDGPGIAPDRLERVFEAYFTTKEKGTGLGLAIVKHNVELYGGTVRVESVLGKGAKFTVVFPAKSQPKPFVK